MTLSTIINLYRKQASMQQQSYQAFKANTLTPQPPEKVNAFIKQTWWVQVMCEKNPPSKKFKEMDYAVKGRVLREILAGK